MESKTLVSEELERKQAAHPLVFSSHSSFSSVEAEEGHLVELQAEQEDLLVTIQVMHRKLEAETERIQMHFG
ncbi:unnamed protein product, partial [Amoebophrya sp. A25]|eukprot:GSA25T00014978001.1